MWGCTIWGNNTANIYRDVLQCVVVCCSLLQCVATHDQGYFQCQYLLQCVALCRTMLQCFAVCCSVKGLTTKSTCSANICCSVLQCVVVCCSVLQCVAVCRDSRSRVTAVPIPRAIIKLSSISNCVWYANSAFPPQSVTCTHTHTHTLTRHHLPLPTPTHLHTTI